MVHYTSAPRPIKWKTTAMLQSLRRESQSTCLVGSNKDDSHLTHRPHPNSTSDIPSFVTNDFFVYSKHQSDPTGSRQLKYWKTANLLQDISVRFQKRCSAKNGRRIENKMANESSDSSNNEDHYR
ncbi:uncharacterized protein LOC143226597 isoform X2 [Tachypleus tridentatus]|uniref:uncharacterized protein LOC143226597 isoform X2 n=1 Tax=Tachypleus tridentatus TaxID=6853 RepID=UPI003FD40DA3